MDSVAVSYILMVLILCGYPFFWIYQSCLAVYLRIRYGDRFRGFFGGVDIAWSIRNGDSNDVVNMKFYVPNNVTPKTILQNTQDKVRHSLFTGDPKHPKIHYKHQRGYGYNFWLHEEPGKVEKYVRLLKFDTNEKVVTEEFLKETLSGVCNSNLPDGNTRNWEVLIGDKPVLVKGTKKVVGVLRIAHCMCDAVGFIRIMEDIFADEPKEMSRIWTKQGRQPTDALLARMKFILKQLLHAHKTFLEIISEFDQNSLQVRKLTGEKVVNWFHEDDERLFDTLKAIKKQFPDIRFNDLTTAILTKAIATYFKAKHEEVPSHLRLFIPDRMTSPDLTAELSNTFLLSVKTVPVKSTIAIPNKAAHFAHHLKMHKQCYPPLNKDPDLLARNWFLVNIFGMTPRLFTERFVMHGSISLSTFPGHDTNLRVGGHEWQDMVGLLPGASLVGTFVMMYTYNGKLQIGILADKTSIKSVEDAGIMVNAIVNEILELKDAFNVKF